MRSLVAFLFLILGCGTIAACSGSVGGGSALPGGQLPPLSNPQTPAPVVTSTPNIATSTLIVTGDGAEQPLTAPGDYKVSAVFPESSASPVTLRVTVSVNGPGDIIPYGGVAKKGLFTKKRPQSPALLYVSFTSDRGATFAALPKLTVTVPLASLDPFGTDPVVDLSMYDPGVEGKWLQRVAERSVATASPTPTAAPSASGGSAGPRSSSSPAASASPSASPSPSPSASSTVRPGSSPSPSPTPGVGAPTATPGPSVVYRFVPTQRTMKLVPKKGFVFVFYAVPAPDPSPSGSARPESSASAAASATGAASSSGSPAASAAPGASGSPAGSPAPAKT